MTNNNNDNDTNDSLLDHKLDLITAGLRPFLKEHLLTKISRENCSTIIGYIMAMQTETNLSDDYRLNIINTLKQLAELYNPKSFKEMTRQDVSDFLDGYRKPESVDPLHKWIGTYEIYRIIFLRFFKWLYYPDLPQDKRPKPAVMVNIDKIKRREISIYKPTDLWTEEEDVIFYKYCPSVRDRCWHAVSRDTGARPIELLRLKIKDVVIQQLDGGYQIAKITVNGKTGVRNVRLNNSYPFLKEWLSMGHHPFPSNPNAALFCGIGKKNTGRRISREAMQAVYRHYKKTHFPKLLEEPTVPEGDKRKIRDLLQKPWNLYIRRHTAATEISKKLKDSVLIDQYMGWSHAGNTRQKYQHYYSDDGIEAMLLADGMPVASSAKGATKNLLKPKQCPNCSESNKQDSKFCTQCKFVLSFDAFNETTKEAENTKRELAELKAKQEEASRKQQLDMEQMKTQLRNTGDQVGMLLQMLSKLQKQGENHGNATIQTPKDFVLKKLGILTNGEIGEDPETGLISEPVESSSKRCIICKAIEGKRQQKIELSATMDGYFSHNKTDCNQQ